MSKLPLVEGVLKLISENNSMFCMPGHKGGKGFLDTEIGLRLYNNFIGADITELEGMDNLHHPDGIIEEAQSLLSNFYGSKKSYFLINGSTSGNLAMIFSSFEEGDKVIVERNCHRSIFNGVIMRKLNPVYIKNKIHKRFNAPLSIDEDYFINLLNSNSDAKGIIITYPNYYGICCNLKYVVEEAHKRGMLVLVDSAHGAHFGVNESLPPSAIELGADLVVMSSHKTLPSLTQTAFLHIGDEVDYEKVDFYVSAFLSTSPSYMLMCSMDYARFFLEYKGKEEYTKLIEKVNYYREKINKLEGFHIVGREDISEFNIDITRYIISLDKGLSGNKLGTYLRGRNIQPEMCEGNNVVLIFSPFNEEKEFKKLYEVLLKCNLYDIKEEVTKVIELNIPRKTLLPFEAIAKDGEFIDFEASEGYTCKEAIVPYPPGVPIILPGEVIDMEIIEYIKYYINTKSTVLGVYENKKIKICRSN